MKSRIDLAQANPKVRQLLLAIERYLHGSSLGSGLQHLVKVRASQINGCAQCIDIHTQEARAEGETEQRLYALDAWRETPFFDERERAALEWTEAVTLLTEGHVPDDVFERVKPHFTDAELIDLTLAVSSINSWNRLNIAFRTIAGSYRPGMYRSVVAEPGAPQP